MNESPRNDTDAIRSDIDQTRQRMDDTMDALGNRLQGKHLVDEILGMFRSKDGESSGPGAGQKIKQSADAAFHAVVDTVKANPMPAILIGAGVAWMIYSSRQNKTVPNGASYDYGESTDYEGNYETDLTLVQGVAYDPDAHLDRPLEYPSDGNGSSNGGKMKQAASRMGDKIGQATVAISEKASAASGQIKEKLGAMGTAAREKMHVAGQRTQEVYNRSRERVVTTADRHPLEMGLACLAVGLLAGLALPRSERVDRIAGPSMDRLRDRTREASRDVVEKGKRVAQAATSAVKQEADAQGLSLDRLKEKAGFVVNRAKDAAANSARQEGMTPQALTGAEMPPSLGGNPTGSMGGNPSTPRSTV